jgi:hypothetical protein
MTDNFVCAVYTVQSTAIVMPIDDGLLTPEWLEWEVGVGNAESTGSWI